MTRRLTSKASEHGAAAAGGGLQLGFTFSDPALLTQALTHRSASRTNNERLEFLGDSVLSTIISEALFARFPKASEGDLSRARARLVRGVTLARLAGELGFMGAVLLGPGERKSGGQRRQSILADALEAVIGAIYLEAGYVSCRQVVLSWFETRLDTLPAPEALKDAKTRLQEYLQQRGRPLPEYQLLSAEGADHAKVFRVRCMLDGDPNGHEASGSSRRKAEQTAAGLALNHLEEGAGD